MTTEAPRLALSVVEAAQAIGVSERCLWGLISAGELPACRVGRRTLIRVTDLDAFLAARVVPVTATEEVTA